MSVHLLNGDAITVLADLGAGSVDACVTDPPYELSQDGKASPNRVFLEMMFPHHPKVVPASAGDVHLPRLIRQILRLRDGGTIPGPAPAVPVGAVALDGDVARGQVDVEDSGVGTIGASDGQRRDDRNAESAEHFGDFTLELTDTAALLNALDRVGCSFLAGGLGVGLRIGPSTLPSLLSARGAVDLCDEDIRSRYDAAADLVRALSGAAGIPVLRLELSRRPLETLTTDGALVLCAVLLAGGAKLIRTETATGRLPAKLESRRICIVDPTTDRALSLNLVLHPQIIASTGFMGKEWDGAKVAYDVAIWREVYRVLKPGSHVIAFGSPRTFHRLMCAIEDAGFELRDTLSWMYGSGFPKGKGCLKPGWEPIILARKRGAAPWLNVDGCRIAGPPSVGGSDGNGALGRMNDDSWQAKPRQIDRELAAGRWPANVVLSHEDGCREVGTKAIRSTNAHGDQKRSSERVQGFAHADDGGIKTYGNGDGTETVAAWECVPECAVRLLDEQSGERPGMPRTTLRKGNSRKGYGGTIGADPAEMSPGYGDVGGASRFFYCSKASSAERRPYNDHPTVKPLALMRWLVRLVTPAGGVVLDPFCGSGSTLIAADREGFEAIGIDSDPHAVEIARRRLAEDAGPLLSPLEAV